MLQFTLSKFLFFFFVYLNKSVFMKEKGKKKCNLKLFEKKNQFRGSFTKWENALKITL
jgi:hypothetical protein